MGLKYLIFLNFLLISSICAGPKLQFSILEGSEFKNPSISDFNKNIGTFRLPNNTIPIHYDISLISDIHVANYDFFGTVVIDFKVLEQSSYVIVNYKQTRIVSVDLLSSSNQLIENGVEFEQIEENEFLVIRPQKELTENQEYKMRINYRGVLRTDDYGFYRARYINEEGREVWLATTQFQATEARHAFPCYDEPRFRTSFSIRIRHSERYRALSNMPVESIEPGPIRGIVVTRFQRVPSMQTYLVAFTVSDFVYVEDASVVPPQRVYARRAPLKNNEADLAMNVSPKIMLTCEEYYGINYTFPKMDQVAITEFAAGAMENWGLVSYREILLLWDPLVRTTRNKEWIIVIIAHEFVHQWIGNIVCPEWWTYLWINEGFATLYQYYIPFYAYPHERYNDLFLMDVMQLVFQVDADPNIRHMSLYVEDPQDILMLFDSVSYSKAGSVLHTFMFALDTNVWQKGIQNFIMDRYDNYANSRHLYESIQRAVNEHLGPNTIEVAKLMETWEMQAGFPLITASRDDGNKLRIKQERFFYNPDDRSENLWFIPINYATASNANFSSGVFISWMTTEEQVLEVDSWDDNDWIILNIQQNYYYRVNYEPDLWNLIINQLNENPVGYKKVHVRNRAQLIDDAFHLARARRLNYGVMFGLMNYMWQETDYIPWLAVYRGNIFLNRWLSGSVVYPAYQKFIMHNSAKYFKKLGSEFLEDELIFERYARSIIVSMACQAQLDECLIQTNQELIAFLDDGKWIAPEYVPLIYCNGMRTANVLYFLLMINRLFQNTDQIERNRIIDGLGCVQNIDLLANLLSLAVLPGVQLSSVERNRIINSPLSNGENSVRTVIRFTKTTYDTIRNITINALPNLLRNIASQVASELVFDEFDDLLSHLVLNDVINVFDFVGFRDASRVNLNWQAENIQDIITFFETWQPQQPQMIN